MPEQRIWGVPLTVLLCNRCDAQYLAPADAPPPQCPNCLRQPLTTDEAPGAAYTGHPPELMLPFTVPHPHLTQQFKEFVDGIWFAPADLTLDLLQQRLQKIYLPMWLVDSEVVAHWQAEVGFDYEVVSHRDSFHQNSGGWVSEQVTEQRIRWEPRIGRLTREYHNIPAPALEEHELLTRRVGAYPLTAAEPYQPQGLAGALVRLPDRPPDDAWPDTIPGHRAAAAAEVRQAGRAQHIREFRWSPDFSNHTWTLLLLPLYTTYYHDDQNEPHQILIHGQTGQLRGRRRASMKRARRAALIILAGATLIFLLSLIAGAASVLLPLLVPLAIIGVVLSMIVAVSALMPIFLAWQSNQQTGQQLT